MDAYRRHSEAVYALARRFGDDSFATDITQDVFTRLWQRHERFDTARGSMRTWLLLTCRGLAIDVLRSEGSRRSREDRYARCVVPVPDGNAEPALRLGRSEAVLEALTALPAREKDAIVTSFFEDKTYREAAELLGAPEGTVKSRIRAGLRTLQAVLDETDADRDSGVSHTEPQIGRIGHPPPGSAPNNP